MEASGRASGRYYAAIDPAEYNYCGVVAEYWCPPETIARYKEERRIIAREERKRKREQREREAALAETTKRKRDDASREDVPPPAKRARLDTPPHAKHAVIDLAGDDYDNDAADLLTDTSRFRALPGERMEIVSMRFIDLHRPEVLLAFDRGQDLTTLVGFRRPAKQSVGQEQRQEDLKGELFSLIGEHVPQWEALYDAAHLPDIVIEAHQDATEDRWTGPVSYGMAHCTRAGIRAGDVAHRLPRPYRRPQNAMGKSGVPRGIPDYHERKRLSVEHTQAAVAYNADAGAQAILTALSAAKLKLDDFCDCYNMIMKRARVDAGIDIVDRIDDVLAAPPA